MDTNNNNPQGSGNDNNQSEYQKILDKYASELATSNTTSSELDVSTPDTTQIPVMPPQYSEALAAVSATPTDTSPDLPLPSLPPLPPLPDITPVEPIAEPQDLPQLTPPPQPIEVTTDNLSEIIPPAEVSIPNTEPLEPPSLHERPPALDLLPSSPDLPPTPPSPDTLTDNAIKAIPLILDNPTPDTQAAPLPVKPNSLSKFFFYISLFIFLGVTAAVAFTFAKSQNLISADNPFSLINNLINKTEELPVVEPTETPADNSPQASACILNDKSYASGESFTAADGCNTCTCLDNGTISCTEKACDDISPPAESPTITTTEMPSSE